MLINKIDISDLDKEYLLTNGLGGFCSSSILRINTRKYHGYLVAPINPPANRTLLISKVDEILQIGDEIFPLYSNMANMTTTSGYKYIKQIKKDVNCEIKMQVQGVEISKTIAMKYMQNTTASLYKIKNNTPKKVKLILTPLFNFRNFHELKSYELDDIEFKEKQNLLKVVIDKNLYLPIYCYLDNGKFVPNLRKFYGMYYLNEDKRGFSSIEDHLIVGDYEVEIGPFELIDISFFGSTLDNICDLNIYDIIDENKARIIDSKKRANIKLKKLYDLNDLKLPKKLSKEELLLNSNDKNINKKNKIDKKIDEQIEEFLIAIDNFLVYRNSFGLYTTIAGYPWFLDWGRDSFISFEGAFLKTKNYEMAKQILLTFSKKIKLGLIPNGFSEDDSKPLYNSCDASLHFIDAIAKYLKYTNDYNFVYDKLYKKIKDILKYYIKRTNLDDNNIYLDKDYLLHSGTLNTQNTWMDAKVNGKCITPRNGKAVEINALFYNSLIIAKNLAKKIDDKDYLVYNEIAKKMQKSFIEKFYCKKTKVLYDVLGDSKIRPNMLYAIGLQNPIIDPSSQIGLNIFKVAKNTLKIPFGLRTLSIKDEGYIEKYQGDEIQRDSSYHNGISWPYLLGIYYDSILNIEKSFEKKYKNIKSKNKTNSKKDEIQIEQMLKKQLQIYENEKIEFRKQIYKTLDKILSKGCIGQISELCDSIYPYEQNGAFAQLWSIAEIFRIILGE